MDSCVVFASLDPKSAAALLLCGKDPAFPPEN